MTVNESGPDEPVDLDLASVAPQTVIRTDEDLDNWLDALRAAVANARAAGARVRIKVTL